MGWKETTIAVAAWLAKAGLLILGIGLLFYPDFALYLRVIGIFAIAIAVFSFKWTQERLLAERGIRIPSVVVGILVIGMLVTVVFVFPAADDLEVTDERAELTNSELVYDMNITNTGDGSVTGTDITVYLNTTSESVAQTQVLKEEDVGRGETRSFTARFQLNDLNAETQSNVENGNYEVYVLIDAIGTNSHTYTP